MNIFGERVERVRKVLEPGSILILPAQVSVIRNRDTHYPYRAHSDMLYLTGVGEEELALAITHEELHIFAQTRNPERERWVGRVKGHEFFLERFAGLSGKVVLHEGSAFDVTVAEMLKGKKLLYHDFGHDAKFDTKIFKHLHETAMFSRKGVFAPRRVVRAAEILQELRLFKDAHDLDCMRRAAKISVAAHAAATRAIEAAEKVSEYEIKALIEHEFMRQRADRLAYPSIVAAGASATVLHYEGTSGVAAAGEFMLIDAGCEVEGYASDITRTTMVGGKKRGSPLKNDLYQLVQAAQHKAIELTRVGTTVEAVHQAAIDTLTLGLLHMGFFKNIPLRHKDEKTEKIEEVKERTLTTLTSLEQIKELEYYNLFYMHKTSHYLGLDVHDVGDYYLNGESRKLESGMVITVEPGLYFPEEYDFLRPEAKGIGIRIEDDVLITAGGNEILTAPQPARVLTPVGKILRMRRYIILPLVLTGFVHANVFDVRGNKIENKFLLGAEFDMTGHLEEGLDRSKGEYSVSYGTFGGSVAAQYYFDDFYLQGGIGLKRLLGLSVNSVSIDMTERVQWHVPFYLHAYYKLHPIFGVGAGFTHLTETTMYVNGSAVPESSYHQVFLDIAGQIKPPLTDTLTLLATAVVGLNMIPGRQHVYSVGDLLHVRFQFNLGLVYSVF